MLDVMTLFDNARKFVHQTLTHYPVTTSLATCAGLTTLCADKRWLNMSPQSWGLSYKLLFPRTQVFLNGQAGRSLHFEPWRLWSNFFYIPPESPILRLIFLLHTIEKSKEFEDKNANLRRKSNLLWVLSFAGITADVIKLSLGNRGPVFLGETVVEAAFVYHLMPKYGHWNEEIERIKRFEFHWSDLSTLLFLLSLSKSRNSAISLSIGATIWVFRDFMFHDRRPYEDQPNEPPVIFEALATFFLDVWRKCVDWAFKGKQDEWVSVGRQLGNGSD